MVWSLLVSKMLRCQFLKMRNIGRRSLESTVESYLFGKWACHSFAADGKTIGHPQQVSGTRCTRLTFEPPKPWLSSLGNFSWNGLLKWEVAGSRHCRWLSARPAGRPGNTPTQYVSPRAARLVSRTRRTRKTTGDMIDLNRVGGEAEFTDLKKESLDFANFGLKVCFHFSERLFYCGRPDSFEGGFPGVSEFNLARIALGLAMPTIFARTMPFKKKISMGMD